MKTARKIPFYAALFCVLAWMGSCMKVEPREQEQFGASGTGLFIVNEGNFAAGNASLSHYDPETGAVENEVFLRANAMKLGDVAQSMVIRGSLGYIVVDKSGVVFIIDIETFKIVGHITGFGNPRYIHFVNDTKAYVTDLYTPKITIIDPRKREITGHIDTGGHSSTEQMVQRGKYVYTNCWSYDNSILVIDSETDEVVHRIEVGKQPTSLVLDMYGYLWTVTDGGYPGSSYGNETPALYRIDTDTWQVEQKFVFASGDSPSELCVNGTGDKLYFLNGSVWTMGISAEELPSEPLLRENGTKYYGLAVNPVNSDVYVADAIDYSQPGMVYRYAADGTLADSFRVGIIPGAFCFK